MAITRATASSVIQGLPKSKNVLAGNAAILPGSFESIQTVTVGAGGASSVQFSSVPSTYKHLQIRALASGGSSGGYSCFMQYNGDTASNYSYHGLRGDGSAAGALSGTSTVYGYIGSGEIIANGFAGFVIDILEYANTNIYKTSRALAGGDANGVGYIALGSGNWRNTQAVDTIRLTNNNGNWNQYSHFALYGIRG